MASAYSTVGSYFPSLNTGADNNQVLVAAPPVVSQPDAAQTSVLGGKQGDELISEMHGKFYTASYRGNCYSASTLAAGIVVPFIAATMASKYSIWNPAASGKVVEFIDINLLQVPGTALVTGAGVVFQANTTTNGGAPSTFTASTGAFGSLRVGSGSNSSACGFYSALTMTNVAISNLSPVLWLYNNVATTVISQGPTTYSFDGKCVMGPDCIVSLADSITSTQSAAAVTMTWAEWPV